MDKEQLHRDLIRYGIIIENEEYDTSDGCHRIMIIDYNHRLYYDHMHNGEVINCHELLSAKER